MSDLMNRQVNGLELMKILARSVAEEVVKELKEEIRAEIREEIRREFKNHFGDLSPAQHAIQHSRFESFLQKVDGLSTNIWGSVVSTGVKWVLGLVAVGYFVWMNKP